MVVLTQVKHGPKGQNLAVGLIKEIIEEIDRQSVPRKWIGTRAGYHQNLITYWAAGKLPKGFQAVVDVAELLGMEVRLVKK